LSEALIHFALLAAVIVAAGTRLSHHADIIAEKSGLGRTWIGVILIASVTSVPELATGISAIVVVEAPDLAVGDILGSCMFNLLIVALMDFFGGGEPIATRAHPGQVVAAGFSILLLSIVALSLLGGHAFPAVGWIGLPTLLVLVGYLLAMRTIFGHEKARLAKEIAVPLHYASISLRRAVTRYILFASVLIVSASLLPRVGARISVESGLGDTFTGNLLIAAATSLPELVVCFTALRMGAVDLALGNILGSNLFNMVILVIDDLALRDGPILQAVAPTQGIAALVAIAMTAVVIVAITIRAGKRFFVSWESIVLLSLYLAGAFLLFALRIPVSELA